MNAALSINLRKTLAVNLRNAHSNKNIINNKREINEMIIN